MDKNKHMKDSILSWLESVNDEENLKFLYDMTQHYYLKENHPELLQECEK